MACGLCHSVKERKNFSVKIQNKTRVAGVEVLPMGIIFEFPKISMI